MKKLCMSLVCVMSLSLSGLAQQIPSSDFDEWTRFMPWWNDGKTWNTTTPVGETPSAENKTRIFWMVSSIMSSDEKSKTLILGEPSPRYNSGSSVRLQNKKWSWLGDLVQPAYISLGKPWSGSSYRPSEKNKDRDFGTCEGKEFKYKPDAISFAYKTDGDVDQPTLILYSYSGSWSQEKVPVNIATKENKGIAYLYTMKNRDRNVLGLNTIQGGTVTNNKGILISKLEERLPFANEWTEKTIEIPPYESEAVPTKLNIIFSAGEYYTLEQKEGATLYLDNVKMVYYSRLASLSVNGVPVPDFNPDVYEYTMAADMPASESEIQAECLGNSNSGEAAVELKPDENKAYITVSNKNKDVDGAIQSDVSDIDGKNTHQYTILFSKSSAITDIESAKAEEKARYFDLRGIEIDKSTLTPGIYIKRVGNTSTKVIIK